MADCPPIPAPDSVPDEAMVVAVAANVRWQMQADRKSTALKQLQVCACACVRASCIFTF